MHNNNNNNKKHASMVLYSPLIWFSNQSMDGFAQRCNDSPTQYILGHWSSLRLEFKLPWIGTVEIVSSSRPSFIYLLSRNISSHYSNSAFGCLPVHYGFVAMFLYFSTC